MSATHTTDSTTATAPVLYLAFELSWTSWKLAFTVGAGQKPRLRSIAARDTDALMLEIRKAKHRFGLPEETPVISCYEAGRDGFWLHRYLDTRAIENLVVDAASIEVNRRKRRAKSDNLDATKLVGDAHPLAPRREEALGRGPCAGGRRRGPPPTAPRADRAEGPAHRAHQPDQGPAGRAGPERPHRRRVPRTARGAPPVGRHRLPSGLR